jgi:hypothetical protein
MKQTLPHLLTPITSPLTRMLLRSDGSTTLLLEALLGTTLQLRVDRHVPTTAQDTDVRILQALRLGEADPLVLRHSRLTLPDGTTASVNQVIFRADPTAWSGQQGDGVPLGLQLMARGVLQRRHLLSAGLDRWPRDPIRPCAFKEYLIHAGEDTPCYVHERFNPDIVPAV